MARWQKIDTASHAVINTEEWDTPPKAGPGFLYHQSDTAGIGDTFDPNARTYTKPVKVPSEPPVPQSVTPRQARLVLLELGLLSKVNEAIAGADEATRIAWEFSNEILRTDSGVLAFAKALGLTDQLDDLFKLAASK